MGDVRISDEAAVLYIDIRTRSQHFRESGQTLMGIFWGLQIIVHREMRMSLTWLMREPEPCCNVGGSLDQVGC